MVSVSNGTDKKAKNNVSSQFVQKNVEIKCRLPPNHLGNVKEGVKKMLDECLMNHVEELDGVVISYSNIEIVGNNARVIADGPYIFFNVKVSFLVFSLSKGSISRGVVNKISPSHIGLLVYNTFNASIHREYLPDKYVYDEEELGWVVDNSKLNSDEDNVNDEDEQESVNSESIEIGSKLNFQVLGIQTDGDVVNIAGNLNYKVYSTNKKSASRKRKSNEVEGKSKKSKKSKKLKKMKKDK